MLLIYGNPDWMWLVEDQSRGRPGTGRVGYFFRTGDYAPGEYIIEPMIAWHRDDGTRISHWWISARFAVQRAKASVAVDAFAPPPDEDFAPVLDAFLELRSQRLRPEMVYTLPGPLPGPDFWSISSTQPPKRRRR